MNFRERKTTKNWAKVEYDRDRWVIVPVTFEGTKWGSLENWALYYAEDRGVREFGEPTKKVMHKEIIPRAASFIDVHRDMAGKMPAQKFFFNWPTWKDVPVPIGIGIWQTMGTREDALDYYTWWSAHDPIDPVAEWVDTEHLGRGVKAHWQAVEDGEPVWAVNYFFRDDAWETDVHVFSSCPLKERFEEVLADLDTLVQNIRCCPRRSATTTTT